MLPGTPNLRDVLGMSNWEGGPAAGPGLARENIHPVWPGGTSGSHRRSCAGEGEVENSLLILLPLRANLRKKWIDGFIKVHECSSVTERAWN